MRELPDEVMQIHSGFLSEFGELNDHAFAGVHTAHNTFYTDGLRKQESRGELRAHPERLASFEIHSREADVAQMGFESYVSPGDFNSG